MQRSDTHPDVERHFDELWRNLSMEERFRKGIVWIQWSRALLLAGLRARFPDFSEEQIRKKLAQELYPSS